MLKPNMIPSEVVDALRGALSGCDCDECLSVSISAALQAWPGMMSVSEVFTAGGDFYRPHLILPLPQEARDE